MNYIKNKTFEEIKIGDTASLKRTLSQKDIEMFAVMSGDINPAHVDREFAQNDHFHKIIAHGMWGGALISTVLGTELPGPGTIYLSQTLEFKKPICIGDTITVTVEVKEKRAPHNIVTFDCKIANESQEEVVHGTAVVMAPVEKIHRPSVELPRVIMRKPGELYEELIKKKCNSHPIKTAVIYPVDEVSLLGAVEAAKAKLIEPILIGPDHLINEAAKKLKIDLNRYLIISAPNSIAAAKAGAGLAYEGKVEAIMKGALHTDELMHAVLNKDYGIATERRMSHVFVMEIPEYPKLLLVSDAAINIYPTLEEKKDIIQNAIDLALAIDIHDPKVAIISAVETVTSKLQSTLDAAALCKMTDRGQIKGAIIDGPLAFDNAISKEAAKIKGITSPVAGDVDIIIMPDLESGNILVKQLEYLSDAQGAGIVLGARVPIILTSRSDKPITRLASSALASILFHYKRTKN